MGLIRLLQRRGETMRGIIVMFMVAAMLFWLAPSETYAASFSPKNGPPGTEITFTGSELLRTKAIGFGKGYYGNIWWNQPAKTTYKVLVGKNEVPGKYRVTLEMANGQSIYLGDFEVTKPAVSAPAQTQTKATLPCPKSIPGMKSISPTSGPPGTQVAIVGDGVPPMQYVLFKNQTAKIVSRSGNTIVFEIPNVPVGYRSYFVIGCGTNNWFVGDFTVTAAAIPPTPPAPAPQQQVIPPPPQSVQASQKQPATQSPAPAKSPCPAMPGTGVQGAVRGASYGTSSGTFKGQSFTCPESSFFMASTDGFWCIKTASCGPTANLCQGASAKTKDDFCSDRSTTPTCPPNFVRLVSPGGWTGTCYGCPAGTSGPDSIGKCRMDCTNPKLASTIPLMYATSYELAVNTINRTEICLSDGNYPSWNSLKYSECVTSDASGVARFKINDPSHRLKSGASYKVRVSYSCGGNRVTSSPDLEFGIMPQITCPAGYHQYYSKLCGNGKNCNLLIKNSPLQIVGPPYCVSDKYVTCPQIRNATRFQPYAKDYSGNFYCQAVDPLTGVAIRDPLSPPLNCTSANGQVVVLSDNTLHCTAVCLTPEICTMK
jgi:hypothetical protein